MTDDVAGTDDYLITCALVIASVWLRQCERYSDAEEKELLICKVARHRPQRISYPVALNHGVSIRFGHASVAAPSLRPRPRPLVTRQLLPNLASQVQLHFEGEDKLTHTGVEIRLTLKVKFKADLDSGEFNHRST
jgi:hypothetical protein